MTASNCNTCARANIPVLFLTVICTLFVFWLLLYSCPVSGSSNYKLGRLDKRKFGTHSLTDSLTDWLTDTTSRAPGLQAGPGLKISYFDEAQELGFLAFWTRNIKMNEINERMQHLKHLNMHLHSWKLDENATSTKWTYVFWLI